MLVLIVIGSLLALAGCHRSASFPWQLNNIVEGHLPDLQFSQLVDDNNQPANAKDYRGKIAILYFGYTHCPDVCPLTLSKLHQAMLELGDLADQVTILFVSVDPARDTPKVLHQYAHAFDPHIVGLTGTNKQIKALAKRYRVGYKRGPLNAYGGYEVSHSAAVYIFDRQGRAKLLMVPSNTSHDIAHDLQHLITRNDT